jgi:hypothetical protein
LAAGDLIYRINETSAVGLSKPQVTPLITERDTVTFLVGRFALVRLDRTNGRALGLTLKSAPGRFTTTLHRMGVTHRCGVASV